MPGFDGTGPDGMGPRTGGGRGCCPPPEYDHQMFGAGRGRAPRGGGRGRAWGGGRGRRYASIPQQDPQVYREYVPVRQDIEFKRDYQEKQTDSLETRVAYLQEQIVELNKRLDELKKTE